RGSMVTAAAMLLAAMTASSQQPSGDGPRYENGTDLVRPADYRSWPFIGAGLGMTYDGERGTQAATQDDPRFTHAFVNPTSYQHFMRTGTWPDGTVFMLEFRGSQTEGSINRAGRFATQLTFLEAEVKDSRFPDGWAFYAFGPGNRLAPAAKPLAGADVAPCVQCHSENGAVERTFVQFYPHLLDVAREKGTLKPGH
ncbi:MAG TPA: cytochrome P460 family protein, partial [Gammaproteobacteria bacterium]|nr:cytochrome P460 family protein [Gammaproteobacteria bacterium]